MPTLPPPRIAGLVAETWGRFTGDNAVLVCHSFSADARAADTPAGPGWWRDLIGPGRAVDTNQWFVVASTLKPGVLNLAEAIAAQDALRANLGVERWRLVVGGSMGGLQALAWALAQPERVERVVAIASAHRLAPSGRRHFLRGLAAVTADLDAGGDGQRGLQTALAEAQGFSGGPASVTSAPLRPSLTPQTYRDRARLLLETDLVQLWGDGDLERAAARIRAAVVLLGYRDDRVFSPTAQRLLTAAIRRQGGEAHHQLLPGHHGHDSFLAEPQTLAPWLASALMPGPWHLPGRRCRPGSSARAA